MDPQQIDALVSAAATRFAFSPSETRELRCVLAGMSCKEAAAVLGVTHETVRQRRKVMYRKASATSAEKLTAMVVGLEAAWPGPAAA